MEILKKTQAALSELFPESTQIALSELFPESTQVAPPELFLESILTSVEEGTDGQDTLVRETDVLVIDCAKHGYHLEVICRPDQVVAVAEIMDKERYFLESISGVDWLEKQQLEVLYDYNRLGGEHCRVMVRTFVPRNEPVIPTISHIFPAADWHERETFDFYGVHFQDHPNLIRILLPEDADFHPLLKDFMP